MRTAAQVTAAKIQRVAARIAEGYEIFEADTGVYMVFEGDYPVEVIAAEYGRPYVYPIPRHADPALLVADLMVKYAADRVAL